MSAFNNQLRQIILLAVILSLGLLILKHFFTFFPGVLGALTLYILSRKSYQRLVGVKKWPKGGTAFLYMLGYLILIGLPIYAAILLLTPRLVHLFNNPVQITIAAQSFAQRVHEALGVELFSGDALQNTSRRLAAGIPSFLTGTANFVTNVLLMFFLLYYMLVNGVKMENYLAGFIPLKEANRVILRDETDLMIKANAIGIPLLAIIQGSVAAGGYALFGIADYGVWGFLTGIASLIPIIGTAVIWIPLCGYLMAIDHVWEGVALGVYSLIVISNIDYIARITLLKKIGDVHPVITVVGVVVGLSMFGLLGLVFGPLLISYLILLVRIYRNEFNDEPIWPLHKGKIPSEKTVFPETMPGHAQPPPT
ncbi:MAG: AI-2E family transporter [Bacteroidota bacterium]|nr:AI-2E family transporter [Bacteroidota bacterium]